MRSHFGFDGFGNSIHAEMFRNRKQSLRQDLIVRIRLDATDKLTINFKNIKPELLQMSKRSDAGTKIVNRKTNPSFLHVYHKFDDQFGHKHRRVFSNLQNQAFAESGIARKHSDQDFHPFTISNRTCGHIDR